MSTYNPDRWTLLYVKYPDATEEVARVYSGNYGGYLGSNTWKLSSEVDVTEVDGDVMKFTTATGSVYICHKDSYGMSGYMMGVYDSIYKDGTDRGIAIRLITQEELFGNDCN